MVHVATILLLTVTLALSASAVFVECFYPAGLQPGFSVNILGNPSAGSPTGCAVSNGLPPRAQWYSDRLRYPRAREGYCRHRPAVIRPYLLLAPVWAVLAQLTVQTQCKALGYTWSQYASAITVPIFGLCMCTSSDPGAAWVINQAVPSVASPPSIGTCETGSYQVGQAIVWAPFVLVTRLSFNTSAPATTCSGALRQSQ